GHVDVMRRHKLEGRAAFEVKGRGRRLVQLRGTVGEPSEGHRSVPRFEEDLAGVVAVALVAVEDVFEVQSRHGGNEQGHWFAAVGEAPDAVVAGAMVAAR